MPSPESRVPSPAVPLARLADLPDGSLLGVTAPDGTPVCLVRHRGRVTALVDRCPHAEFSLSAGELLPDGGLQCLWHGAIFDCATGAVRQGPADEDARVVEVEIVDGAVYVKEARNGERGAPHTDRHGEQG